MIPFRAGKPLDFYANPQSTPAMPAKIWMFDPHSGGRPVPPALKQSIVARVEAHAAKHYAGKYIRLEITFRGPLCYLNAFQEPEPPGAPFSAATGETLEEYLTRLRSNPIRLGRLRHFAPDRWSYAFYTYSNERYEPTCFPHGDWFGTPEQAFDIGATYL